MVDAYEIGIELALQDGVSAGLEAVAKELAALDAAVAASSAGLMALVRTAGLAVEAVAAVGGVRVRAPVAAPAAVGGGGTDATAAPGERTVPVVRDEAQGATAPAAAALGVAERVAVPVTAVEMPGAAVERILVREVSRDVERVPVVAPVAVVTRPADAVGAAPSPERVTAYCPDGSAVPVRALVRETVFEAGMPRDMAGVRVGRDDLVAAGAAPAPILRAEVARAMPERRAISLDGAAPPNRGAASAGFDDGRRDAVAPMPGALTAGVAGSDGRGRGGAAGASERTAAPMRMAAGPGGSGTVLLDGRLVGEWLIDRMARDAGRPGAGTTSFDPRQGAAWTPSGVG